MEKTPKLARTLSLMAWGFCAVLGLLFFLIGGTVLYLRSQPGQERLLAAFLPLVNQHLTGRLAVGRLAGDLVHKLAFCDLALYDSEEELVLLIPRIELHYDLTSLFRRQLHLSALKIEGGFVRARYLRDGRMNLATLVKKGPEKPRSKLPLSLFVDGITVDLAAQLEPQTLAPDALPFSQARVQLAAAVQIVDPRITAQVNALTVHSSEPLRAALALQGGIDVADFDAALATAAVRDLVLSLQAQGNELTRLVRSAALRGDFALALRFSGTLSALQIEGMLKPPKGHVALHAALALPVSAAEPWVFLAPSWQLCVETHGVDLAAFKTGWPESALAFHVCGHGQGLTGRIDLQQLFIAAPGGKINFVGAIEGNPRSPLGPSLPVPKELAAQFALDLDSRDLGALAQPFLPALRLSGALQAKVRGVLSGGRLRLDADLGGQRLRVAQNRIEDLRLLLHSEDLRGRIELRARALHTPVVLDDLHLDATLGQTSLSLRAQGRYKQKLTFLLALAGQKKMHDAKLARIDASLNELWLKRAGQQLALCAPAALHLDLLGADAPSFGVEHLVVGLGKDRLRLSGRYAKRTERFRIALESPHINAKKWAALVGRSDVPATALALSAQLAGTPFWPTGRLRLFGQVAKLPALSLPQSQISLDAQLGGRRARGSLMLELKAAGSPAYANLHFDASLRAREPIDIELFAKTPVELWHALLPPAAQGLAGRLALRATLRGSLLQPVLELGLSVPSWQLAELYGSGTAFTLTYGRGQLAARLDARLVARTEQREQPLGVAALRAQLPLEISLRSRAKQFDLAGLKQQLFQNPGTIHVSLLGINVPKLLAALQTPPLLEAGLFDITMHIAGTAMAPRIELHIDGRELAVQALRRLSVAVSGHYAADALQLELSAGLPKKQMLDARAETTFAWPSLLFGKLDTKRLPIFAKLVVNPFELSQVSSITGSVSAYAEAHGQIGAPEVTAWARSQGVELGGFRVGPLAMDAALGSDHRLRADIDARQPAGRLRLKVEATQPLGLETAKLQLLLQNFHADYAPSGSILKSTAALRMLHGVLNGDLSLVGTPAGPRLGGFLKLEHGAVMARALSQPFSDINLDLAVASTETQGDAPALRTDVTLRELRLATETGKAQGTGSLELSGMRINSVALDANLTNFPVQAGAYGIWIDTQVKVRGRSDGDTLRADVYIPTGTVRTPKFGAGRQLQSLEPLQDIRFTDPAAEKQATAARVAQEKAERTHAQGPPAGPSRLLPSHTQVSVSLPSALHITGPEVRADLSGHLDLALEPDGEPRITGVVRAFPGWGWVELLRHRYDLNRAEMSLAGETPPNPLFNIEISRRLEEATIYVLVTGSAQAPRISFRSDPAIYDESQILAIILTGESGGGKRQPQALSMLSSFVIGQIRDQLAGQLPVDVLRVDAAGEDPMGLQRTSLELGKFLRDDLYLGYTHRFGGALIGIRRFNLDEVRLEYRFLRRFRLITIYGDANVGSLDLAWLKRF